MSRFDYENYGFYHIENFVQLLYFCLKMLLIWWRRESCLFQKDCSTIELPQAEIQDFQTQWRHDGAGAAATAEESWAAARAPTIIPGHFQTKCINTHTHKIANFLNVITHHSFFYQKKS